MPSPAETARPPRRPDAPAGGGDNVALIALIAFVFGVFLNGYIVFSVLGDNSSASPPANDAPQIVPAAATASPTPTETPLPDRKDCEEIRGTAYHSPSEREFFQANCINQPEATPTLDPDAPPLDGGTSTAPEDADSTATPEP